MSVRLIGRDLGTIYVNDMKDGQLAEIVQWVGRDDYAGRVMQRCGDALVTIGRGSEQVFQHVLPGIDALLRVRPLRPGEMIEVVENEG